MKQRWGITSVVACVRCIICFGFCSFMKDMFLLLFELVGIALYEFYDVWTKSNLWGVKLINNSLEFYLRIPIFYILFVISFFVFLNRNLSNYKCFFDWPLNFKLSSFLFVEKARNSVHSGSVVHLLLLLLFSLLCENTNIVFVLPSLGLYPFPLIDCLEFASYLWLLSEIGIYMVNDGCIFLICLSDLFIICLLL